jgi:hypothetical protein
VRGASENIGNIKEYQMSEVEKALEAVAAALEKAGITWGDNVELPARVEGLVKHYRAAVEEASVVNRLGKLGLRPGDILLLRPENPMTQNQKTAFMEMLGQHVRKLDTSKPVSVVVLQPHDSLVVLRPVDLPGAPGGELSVVEDPRSRKLAPSDEAEALVDRAGTPPNEALDQGPFADQDTYRNPG